MPVAKAPTLPVAFRRRLWHTISCLARRFAAPTSPMEVLRWLKQGTPTVPDLLPASTSRLPPMTWTTTWGTIIGRHRCGRGGRWCGDTRRHPWLKQNANLVILAAAGAACRWGCWWFWVGLLGWFGGEADAIDGGRCPAGGEVPAAGSVAIGPAGDPTGQPAGTTNRPAQPTPSPAQAAPRRGCK